MQNGQWQTRTVAAATKAVMRKRCVFVFLQDGRPSAAAAAAAMPARQVLELIGQGPGAGGRKRGALGPAPRDRHSRGMDDTMQQQVLALFKVRRGCVTV